MIDDSKDPLMMFARSQSKSMNSKTLEPKRTYKSPEKDLEALVLDWLRLNKFDVNVVEAKAVFNPKIKRYISGMTTPGFPDVVGNDCDGNAVFVELKAPGRRSTIRDDQYRFLMRKIESNCFAVCIDSLGMLQQLYNGWKSLDRDDRQDFLLTQLRGGSHGKEKSKG